MADPSAAALHDASRVRRRRLAPGARPRRRRTLRARRGGSADDIAASHGARRRRAVLSRARSDTGHTWYPQRFLAPRAANEPWLGSALGVVARWRTGGWGRCADQPDRRRRLLTRRVAWRRVRGAEPGPLRRRARLLRVLDRGAGRPRPAVAGRPSLDGNPGVPGLRLHSTHTSRSTASSPAGAVSAAGAAVDLRIYRDGHTINADDIAAARRC